MVIHLEIKLLVASRRIYTLLKRTAEGKSHGGIGTAHQCTRKILDNCLDGLFNDRETLDEKQLRQRNYHFEGPPAGLPLFAAPYLLVSSLTYADDSGSGYAYYRVEWLSGTLGIDMMDQFINFVIRPPRADYNPDQYLWEKNFTLAGRAYQRQDLEASMDGKILP
ncbi:hypothetical protein SDJN02_10695, partial [Cucurbita argyrosperma subsp. argyrosperma]